MKQDQGAKRSNGDVGGALSCEITVTMVVVAGSIWWLALDLWRDERGIREGVTGLEEKGSNHVTRNMRYSIPGLAQCQITR